jgi:hypothetical protein
MPTDTLNLRALNRALLARQMLLCPVSLPAGPDRAEAVIGMIEHLAGLQAQAPFPPYFGLWSRLVGFQPADLAELLVSRQVVRIALMRSIIHLVSARDCLTFRPLVQPVLDRSLPAIFGKQFAGLDAGALAEAGRALVDAEPRTLSELGNLLAPTGPVTPPPLSPRASARWSRWSRCRPVPSGAPPGRRGTLPRKPGSAGRWTPTRRWTSWLRVTSRRSGRPRSPTCRPGPA